MTDNPDSSPPESQGHLSLTGFAVILAIITAIAIFYALSSSANKLDQAKKLVADKLKDPPSAQFRGVESVDSNTVCGEVNGKNSFGAYTGYKWFMADIHAKGEGFVSFEDDVLGHFVIKYCSNHPKYDPDYEDES